MVENRLRLKVIKANIKYHSAMADRYNQEQPHFKTENVARVRQILKELSERFGNQALLDIGCGTGFITTLAEKLFDIVIGIDITKSMIRAVPKNKRLELVLSDASCIPLVENTFNLCTAYSFLHHVPKIEIIAKEVFRCLKKGGAFYTDLVPCMHACWTRRQ